jgi:hypothetical protein
MSPDLVLGDPGLADAALQVIQACTPGRRMLVAGCDSVWFSQAFCTGEIADGMIAITASQDASASSEATAEMAGSAGEPDGRAPARAVPRPRAGSGDRGASVPGPAWHVRMADAAGQVLVVWDGLRMRDAGPLLQLSPPAASQLATAD